MSVYDTIYKRIDAKKYNGKGGITLFYQDLLEEYGIEDNVKSQKAFSIAWDRGHSSGFGDVLSYFDELVDLIR